jgi:membrane protease YdiL (CAAX protease family)
VKNCPYCGKEYSDEVTVCSIDGETLFDDKPQQKPEPKPNTPYVTFPDYQWSAKDAWKCLGILLILENVLALIFSALDWEFRSFYVWHKSGFGYFSAGVLHSSIFLLTAAYFARTETLKCFCRGLGLDRKPSEYVWSGVTLAVILRLSSHFILVHNWGKGVANYEINAFGQTTGAERYFYLLPALVLAPIFEEAVNRGFLYRAFRGSYSVGISMLLILVWTAFTHWSQYLHSWIASVVLSCVTLVQCYLREKSDSLWDCILCHFGFNVSLLFISASLR